MRHRDPALLFHDRDLSDHLREREKSMKEEIDAYEANRLLNTSVDGLSSYFVEKFSIEPLALDAEGITTDQHETQIDVSRIRDGRFLFDDDQRQVPGHAFEFFVPFSGDPALFGLKPNSYTLNPPRAQVRGQDLVFRFEVHGSDAANVKPEFERRLRDTQDYVRNSGSQVQAFNNALLGVARNAISSRRERLLNAQNMTAALGYPMRQRAGSPSTYAPPSVRRKLLPTPPPASSAPYRPEPALRMEDYEHILGVLQSMALVLERSPSAFKTMGEEDLRQHFLVQLNGHYEGRATGETFNGDGKTDILIREGDRNIFIAECKFWRGPAAFQETIDQLLGYLSWRDTKTAIVLFNRETAFTTVLSKIPQGLASHPNFKQHVELAGETRFRSVFRHRDDPNRELLLTVLAFDVPR